MKLKQTFLLVGLLVIASAYTFSSYMNTSKDKPLITNLKPGTWTDFETAVKAANIDQKKILVDVYTDWCKWCKVMDKETFSESSVASLLAEKYHLVKFNAEQKEVISFKGKNYAFKGKGKRGYHELAAEILDGRLAYPSLVVFDSKLNKLKVVRGFKKPEEFKEILAQLEDS